MTFPDRRVSTAIAAAIAGCATIGTFAPAIPWRVSTGDTAEAQTVPYILGISHPTGFPAFTLLGWVFSHAVAISTIAWRMNAFTALCVALTAAGVVLLATALECNVFAALAAALLFAFGSVVRSEAVLANAHALASLCAIFSLVASVWYARNGDRRALIAACACAGLGLATHPATIWVLPGILVAGAWQWKTLTARTIAFAGLVLVAPLLLYLYLPLRSTVVAAQHLDPTAAAPVLGVGSLDWDTNQPRTLDGFLDEVLGRRVGAGGSLKYMVGQRVITRAAALWTRYANRQYAVGLQLLAVIGLIALAQRGRRGLSVVVAGTLGSVLFAGVYQADANIYWYLVVPFGVCAALAAASTRLALRRIHPAAAAVSVSIALAVAAVVTWSSDRPANGIAVPPDGQAIIDAVARDVPDCSIVVAPWYEAAALGYGAAIEHALGSRTIVTGFPGDYVRNFPAWSSERLVIVYAGGLELMSIGAIPPVWIDELQSSRPFYRVLAIRPRLGGRPVIGAKGCP